MIKQQSIQLTASLQTRKFENLDIRINLA